MQAVCVLDETIVTMNCTNQKQYLAFFFTRYEKYFEITVISLIFSWIILALQFSGLCFIRRRKILLPDHNTYTHAYVHRVNQTIESETFSISDVDTSVNEQHHQTGLKAAMHVIITKRTIRHMLHCRECEQLTSVL